MINRIRFKKQDTEEMDLGISNANKCADKQGGKCIGEYYNVTLLHYRYVYHSIIYYTIEYNK